MAGRGIRRSGGGGDAITVDMIVAAISEGFDKVQADITKMSKAAVSAQNDMTKAQQENIKVAEAQ